MKIIILIVLLIIIVFTGFYFLQIKKDSSPTPIEITPTITTSQEPTEAQIIKALSEKNSWDESNIEVGISRVEGNFAKGSVNPKDEMGGGLWFAAKVNGIWKIVYDGNGIITCSQLADYQNFPKDLIPSCYDEQTEKLLTR